MISIKEIKGKYILIILGGLITSWVVAVIFTPAFEIPGNAVEKINSLAGCLQFPFNMSISRTTVKAFLIILFIYSFGIALYLSTRQNMRAQEEYGSAKWGNVMSLCRKYMDKDYFKNRLLTQNLRVSETGRKIFLNLITLVIGGSGAGKSFFYCIPNLLQAQSSLIVLDPSAELLRRTGKFLEGEGYKIRALNLDDMKESFGYNPFSYIKSDDDILRLVRNLFKATVPKGSHSNDPMWDNQAEALCMAYMFLIYYEAGEDEKNMRTLMYVAREDVVIEDEDGQIQETAISALFKKIELENPEHASVRFYKTAMKGTAKTVLGVQTTLMGRLAKFNLESLLKLTDYDELELESIGKEKTALFLVIPAEDTSFNFLVSMLYSQLIPTLYKQAKSNTDLKLKVPVHFLMDEFCNVSLPDDFLVILTTARKHNISFSMIIQAISQLKPLFEKEQFNTLIGNADEFVYLGSGEFETQKYISERIGKETIIVKSYSMSRGFHGNSSQNMQPAARSLLDPAEVDTFLGESRALVKLRGNSWVIDQKIDPKSHPNYMFTADVTGKVYEISSNKNTTAVINFDKNANGADIIVDTNEISSDIFERIKIITGEEIEYVTERRA